MNSVVKLQQLPRERTSRPRGSGGEAMAFFQSKFTIRQGPKHNAATFGPEIASDIVFRAAHRGEHSKAFMVNGPVPGVRGDAGVDGIVKGGSTSARVHSSAGAALLARGKR